jgi:hypothetical protein
MIFRSFNLLKEIGKKGDDDVSMTSSMAAGSDGDLAGARDLRPGFWRTPTRRGRRGEPNGTHHNDKRRTTTAGDERRRRGGSA